MCAHLRKNSTCSAAIIIHAKKQKIMAKNHFLARRTSSLVDAHLALQQGTLCQQTNGQKHKALATVQVLILCSDQLTLQRAMHIIKRDLRSHLINLQHNDTTVCAQLRTLDLFSASECISFYHYHLQRSLGAKAQVWLSTKGGLV